MRLIRPALLALSLSALSLGGCSAQYSALVRNETAEPLVAALLQNDEDEHPAVQASVAPGGEFYCRISKSERSERLLRIWVPEYGPASVQQRTIARGDRLQLKAVREDHRLQLLEYDPPWKGPAYSRP